MQRVGWGRGGRDPDDRGGQDGAGSRPAHSPYGPDFPRYPDGPWLCPWWLGRRSWVDLQGRPHLRDARQVPAPMSAPSRGAGSAGSDCRPGCFLWNGSSRVPTFVGFASGPWWPNLGVVIRRCRVMTATMMIINGLSFSGPCLFFTSR